MRKVLLLGALFSSFALAQTTEDKIRQLEEQIKALQHEIQRLKEEQERSKKEASEESEVLKEEIRKLRLEIAMPSVEFRSYSGLGPAASKALFNPKGVSVGGYGELTFEHNDVDKRGGAKSIADMQRFVVYLGYAFTERLKFTSELELEHASTSEEQGTGGEYFKAELAMLDYAYRPELGFRGGLLLMPVGIINEVHEPPTFPSAQRPFLERTLIPSTWEEMGLGIYGTIKNVDYRFYVTNGLMINGNEKTSNTRIMQSLKQRGARAVADRLGFTGRIDLKLPYNLKLGSSFFYGDVQSKGGMDSSLGLRRGSKVGSVFLLSPHLWWQYAGFDIRFVGAFVNFTDAKRIGQDAGINGFPSKQQGFYVQVAYDLFRLFDMSNQELYLFGIYENIDTHKEVPDGFIKPVGHRRDIYNLGLSYKPHPLVAIKTDYVRINYKDNKKDENEYRLTLGFMF
ncbi:cell division protein ZapB [Thermocrinis minervae]|uniref:FlxA-like protein n=1 Tax=Thermocrinis minervae TaxID=381751 RepID=A0A1M6S3G6_9AQUI|nr:cell division protein ZapB [Thermocrinis minervae]SHK39265.1 FlxA-like protein [Thermocrinis minervae]